MTGRNMATPSPRCPRVSTGFARERRRGKTSGGWVRAVAALALLPSLGAADKAAYSLDLIGIKSATAYTVVVDIGTSSPAVSFRLIADTGSSNDAVLGDGCCGSDADVTYSCDASSTCVTSSTSVTLAFAGATIAGHFTKDTWSSTEIGSITKDFLVIDQQDTFYRDEYDGITGLAYKALAKPTSAPKTSFYENLIEAKSGTPDAFGMLLCGIMQPLLYKSNYSMHAGQLLIGGLDGTKGETYYTGPMLYTPIAQEAWYVVIVSDVGFDGQSLGLPCSSYNQPQAIIDSGTSNIAFPSDVYNALMALIETATKKAVPSFSSSYFDYSKSCCGQDYCDPSDASLALLTLPSIYITLALDDDSSSGTKSHYTVEIPPEYYYRPEMNGQNSDVPCRAIGIAEGSSVVLGDVFMDGLFAYHDRANAKLGLAVAGNCPNGANSTKKISKTPSKTDDWCDCFSDTLQSKSTLAHYVPWGGGCFFMPWWLWFVLASGLVVVICVGVLGYWYWSGKKTKRAAAEIQASAVAPTDMHTLNGGAGGAGAAAGTAAAKSQLPSQQRQPPSQAQAPAADVGHDYAIMDSPRESFDARQSSVALLTSHDDHPPTRVKTGEQTLTYHVQQGKRQPSRRDSDRSTSSTARETSGFLL